MSIETEIKDLTKAIEANTAAIMGSHSKDVPEVKKPEAKKPAAKKPETTKKVAAAKVAEADDGLGAEHTIESIKTLAMEAISSGKIERSAVKKMIAECGAESIKDLDADGLAAMGTNLEALK